MWMLWAQIFPFMALQLHKEVEGDGDRIVILKSFLIGSLVLWMVLNVAFLCTIDMKYVASEVIAKRLKKLYFLAKRLSLSYS